MLIKAVRYTITSAATVAEIFIAIFGACVVNLGPVYRQLRYGDPQGRSSKSKKAGSGGESWGKGNKGVASMSVHTHDSFQRLDGHDEGRETTIIGGGHYIDVPMRGIIVERGLDWSEDHGSAC